MNLIKLFETQKVLRDRINYNEPDRFDKLVLALLVELGECANEWRGFKFWSKNQKPKLGMSTSTNKEEEVEYYLCGECNRTYSLVEVAMFEYKDECPNCESSIFGMKSTNPLLEEFVDGLHFILELGIEIEINYQEWNYSPFSRLNVTDKFTDIYEATIILSGSKQDQDWVDLFEHYLGLGELLGFDWEEIEKAYFDKNEVNHKRQTLGY